MARKRQGLRSVAERSGMGLGLDLGGNRMPERNMDTPDLGLNGMMDAFERKVIITALRKANGIMSEAMMSLQLPRRTLNEKMRRLRIENPNMPEGANISEKKPDNPMKYRII